METCPSPLGGCSGSYQVDPSLYVSLFSLMKGCTTAWHQIPRDRPQPQYSSKLKVNSFMANRSGLVAPTLQWAYTMTNFSQILALFPTYLTSLFFLFGENIKLPLHGPILTSSELATMIVSRCASTRMTALGVRVILGTCLRETGRCAKVNYFSSFICAYE